ncbi:helix-turn-helix transcriptional regulator [Cohnella phaseoli]|uniref:AraC-like DNA-binding protein n=1 Tax=Cohnella phaseoli TaxID=456490 RepID=A0A3D9IU26_9BACL|nr:AraC family transcriptional regulator [Cohnella phaseoli]RED65303.1 AraC-like DNA-binding protein [Cohnella phaseoli]
MTTRKTPLPASRSRYKGSSELREELPFQHDFDNLSYIGIQMLSTWQVDRHTHEHFELCYVDEGQGWFSIDGDLYRVRQGDLFLTKPGEGHQGASLGESYRLYYTGFQLTNRQKLEADFYRLGRARTVRDTSGDVKRLFDAVFAEIEDPGPHSALMAESLFQQLLVRVIRLYRDAALPDGGPEQGPLAPAMKELLQYLHEHASIGINALDLAKRQHLSRTHLEREFKRSFGIPLGKYIRMLCTDRAKYWLAETGETITSVAERLGFSSLHAFSVFFKRQTGISPYAYRRPFSPNDEKR